MGVTARKHDLIALKLGDSLEMKIPRTGLIRFQDLETGAECLVDTSSKRFKKLFKKRVIDRNRNFDNMTMKMGVDKIYIPAGGDYSIPLIRFFEMRAKRIRR